MIWKEVPSCLHGTMNFYHDLESSAFPIQSHVLKIVSRCRVSVGFRVVWGSASYVFYESKIDATEHSRVLYNRPHPFLLCQTGCWVLRLVRCEIQRKWFSCFLTTYSNSTSPHSCKAADALHEDVCTYPTHNSGRCVQH